MVVVLQALVVIGLEAVIASQFLNNYSKLQNTPAQGIPVYLLIFLFSQVFQIGLCWEAAVNQNTIQIIGFVLFNACTFAYSIFQYNQLLEALEFDQISAIMSAQSLTPILIGVISVLGALLPVHLFLAYKLYLEFGWKIYKKIGADPEMKKMYRWYQILLLLLKLDFFFFLGFTVQFMVLVLDVDDPEFALTLVAIPATMVVLAMAVYGLRQENRTVTGLFVVGCLLACAYFIFKMVRMYEPSQASKYEYTRKFLTFFASLSLAVVFATLVITRICFSNFDRGLKPHIEIRRRGCRKQRSNDAEKQSSNDESAMKQVMAAD